MSCNSSCDSSTSCNVSNNYYSNFVIRQKRRNKYRTKYRKKRRAKHCTKKRKIKTTVTKRNKKQSISKNSSNSKIFKQIKRIRKPIILTRKTIFVFIIQLNQDIALCRKAIALHDKNKHSNILDLNVICPFSELLCRHRSSKETYLNVIAFFAEYSRYVQNQSRKSISLQKLIRQFENRWKRSAINFACIELTLKNDFINKLSSIYK